MAKRLIDFGGNAQQLYDSDTALTMALDFNDRIVLAGRSEVGQQSGASFSVARLDANGQLDNSFDGDGKKTISFGPGYDLCNAVAIDATGRILVAGESRHNHDPDSAMDIAIVQLDNHGQLDLTFDDDGWLRSPGPVTSPGSWEDLAT